MLEPTLELDQRKVISELGDDLRTFLTTTWNCINFVDGRIRSIPYLDFDKTRELKMALIGDSSWRCCCPVPILEIDGLPQ